MARLEANLLVINKSNIIISLQSSIKNRTYDAIKSHFRTADYKNLVSQLKNSLAPQPDNIAFTPRGLQRQVNLLSARFKQYGLSVNPSKCKTLNIVVNQKRRVWACESRPFLNIGLENIGALQVLDTYKYLGIETGILKPNNGPIYCNFNNNLAKLDRCPAKASPKS